MVYPILKTGNIKKERTIMYFILEVKFEVPGRIQVEVSIAR